MKGSRTLQSCTWTLQLAVMTCLFSVITFAFSEGLSADPGEQFRIGIMNAKRGEAQKYTPLIVYMAAKGIPVRLVGTRSYDRAAEKFAQGDLDAMFSGSGVAGCMIIKDLAYPLVRPVSKEGWSTYWAVIIAGKGTKDFDGTPEFFKGKRVLCCQLASSGEFFVRAVYGGRKLTCDLMAASSHGAALTALSKGVADIAVVKNRVYDAMIGDREMQATLSDLQEVGRHHGENPNGTLIISKSVSEEMKKKVRDALLAVEADPSAEATSLKESLNITKYIVTTVDDFAFTLSLLRDAGVTENFRFTFNDS